MLPPLPDADSALSLPELSRVTLGEVTIISPAVPVALWEKTNKPLLKFELLPESKITSSFCLRGALTLSRQFAQVGTAQATGSPLPFFGNTGGNFTLEDEPVCS